MDYIRDEAEVLLHQLLGSLIDSRNLYETVAEFPELKPIRKPLNDIVSERSRLIEKTQRCVLNSGQLPSDGNHDLTTVLGFGARMEAMIDDNPLRATVARLKSTEKNLLITTKKCLEEIEEDEIQSLIEVIDQHLRQTLKTVEGFAD